MHNIITGSLILLKYEVHFFASMKNHQLPKTPHLWDVVQRSEDYSEDYFKTGSRDANRLLVNLLVGSFHFNFVKL